MALPTIQDYSTNNGHIFYLVCNNIDQRTKLIQHLRKNDIEAVFHYLSLHRSPYYQNKHDGRLLPNSDKFTDCLLRLPLFYELDNNRIDYIISKLVE